MATLHQYIERGSGRIRTERLYHDRLIRVLYGPAREYAPSLLRAFTSRRATRLFGLLSYDSAWTSSAFGSRRFLRKLGINLSECVQPAERLDTPRKVFERQIRYWDCRPMPDDPVVSPADARVLVGSLAETSQLRIKDKFFRLEELLGDAGAPWLEAFRDGDFAIFRLTPDKYHYNHAPVTGIVRDFYEVTGTYNSCNPAAVVALATPYSKNARVVTIVDTDVPGGGGVGLVAMIEIVALMIGRVEQCYSVWRYEDPRPISPGMVVRRGQPKSLYHPGSSTDVLLFQRGRIEFASDLVANLSAPVASRFSQGFGRPLVETDVQVRSSLAVGRAASHSPCAALAGMHTLARRIDV